MLLQGGQIYLVQACMFSMRFEEEAMRRSRILFELGLVA